MKFIIDMIKGMFVGVANVIPGVSGGTMAVSMGVYDKILSAISNLLKQFKKSVKTLLPIIIGCAIGVILFAKAVGYLLDSQPFITAIAFTGLIIGGLPIMFSNMKEGYNKEAKHHTAICIIVFLIFLAISIILPLLSADSVISSEIEMSAIMFIKLLLMGVIASATMVIPGVSGSLILMILGYYFAIIGAINEFIHALTHFDINTMLRLCLILVPFGIGCILGIFLIAKLIEWLFKRFFTITYSAILGLIISSPFAIFYKVQQESPMNDTGIISIIIGAVVFALCVFVTYKLGKLSGNEEKEDA